MPLDLGADDRRQLVDGDGLVRRALFGDVPITGAGVAAQRSLHGSLLLQLYIATPDDLSPALLLVRRAAMHAEARRIAVPYGRNSASSRSSASAAPV